MPLARRYPQAGWLAEPRSAVRTRKEGADRPVLAGCRGWRACEYLSCTDALLVREAAAAALGQGAQPGRGEEPGMAQPSLEAQTCWPCPGGYCPSPAPLSHCFTLAPKQQLKACARRSRATLGIAVPPGPFLAWHVLQREGPHPLERVDRAPGARPGAKDGFGGCNMKLGYEEAEITTACPLMPRHAVGFPPGAV